jgi:hypothetical protein
MKVSLFLLLTLLLLVYISCSSRLIRLESERIDTENSFSLNSFLTSADLGGEEGNSENGVGGYLIHYSPPLTAQLKGSIENILGQPLLRYYPDNTYLVFTVPAKIKQLKEEVKEVLYVANYQPHHKIHSSINSFTTLALNEAEKNEIPELHVLLADIENSWENAKILAEEHERKLNAQHKIDAKIDVLAPYKLHITLKSEENARSAINYFSNQASVHLIMRRPEFELSNRWSRGLSQNNLADISYSSVGIIRLTHKCS